MPEAVRRKGHHMKYKWIFKKGSCMSKEIISIIKENMGPDYLYLAGCTDLYASGAGNPEAFLIEKADALLELRVFSEEKELLFTRSMIGRQFQWRLTNDENLERTDYLDTTQYLDINPEFSVKKGDRMQLFTTVGGAYSLPIREDRNAVKIRSYITYDKNGMASVTDHRVCGFTRRQG